jgi:mono/diheme cytochrome c family protein
MLRLPSIGRYCFPACVTVWLLTLTQAPAGDGRSGEQIYRQRCVSCHGASGEGTDENYPHPLAGQRTLPQLVRFIAKSMPKGAEQKCTGEDAEKVAGYIFDAFYSREAQERNKPPRVELARLTVRQYRNAVADLIGSFRNADQPDGRQGLRGEYFKLNHIRDHDRVIDRVDPVVQFDYGTASPAGDKIDSKDFAIRWMGSVFAPETGEYEFLVRTEHSVRLWINDNNKPIIDAWVKSGNDTEHTGSIMLLGGRYYPLRLEFSKGKQGVEDSKEQKAKRPVVKASVSLEWKPPRQVTQVIPSRCLTPTSLPESFVLATPFPPDDRSIGYERGTSISQAWDQATTEAAIEVAGYVAAHLRELAGVPDHGADRATKVREFCGRFAERAFRRPLTADEQRLYITKQLERARDPDIALKRVLLLVLKSPRFLYREIDGGIDGYNVASRVSFGLWDSLPDKDLLKDAGSGKLTTREQAAQQAERMLANPRSRAKVRGFFFQWLKLDPAPDISKAKDRFPGFDQRTACDLRTSLDLFLDDVFWSEGSDFRQLFLADYLYLNGNLAKLYGGSLLSDAPFQKVAEDPHTRAGILSHPYLMATFSYTATSSPIHRGLFLARNVLGVSLRPPPEAFTPLPPELHPELTTRERVTLQTRPQQCQACHAVINPLGFTLENFDAIGRYRDREMGKLIDATGAYETRAGERRKLAGVRDLATFLAGSPEAQDAFIEHLFHYLIKQPIRAFGPKELAELHRYFVAHNYNMRKLIVEIMASTAGTL